MGQQGTWLACSTSNTLGMPAGQAGSHPWKYREQNLKRLYVVTSILSTHLTHLEPNWCLATSLTGYPWSGGKVSPFTS